MKEFNAARFGRFPVMKMHGCGNDFVVYTDFEDKTTPEQAKAICSPHIGVGADGVITVLESRRIPSDAEYRMKVFNPDGSVAEMCGNGIRCFAKYLVDNALVKKGPIPVDTDAGLIIPVVETNSELEARVKVDMGVPILYNPAQVTLKPDEKGIVSGVFPSDTSRIPAGRFTYVCMGNPHAVVFTKGNLDEWVTEYGPRIENDRDTFPQKTNVEFVKVNSTVDLTMRVWERGAGETLACGTGSCASLVAAVLEGHCRDRANVHLKGGDLHIYWQGIGEHVYMTGPARNVFEIKGLTI